MQFSQIFGIRIGLHHGNLLATVLLDHRWIRSIYVLRIRLGTGVEKGVRMATNDNVHLRTVLGYLQILQITRVAKSDNDFDTLCLQFICFNTLE